MTPDDDSALNVGKLLREGVRLTTAEAVAVVHAACVQVSRGAAAALPQRADDVWITDEGTLRTTVPAIAVGARSGVAALLEGLLPGLSHGPAYAVPSALRTLPARLRASGDGANNDIGDLLLSLSRYLPSDPRDLLKQFVERVRDKTAPEVVAPAAAVVAPAATAIAEVAVIELPLQVAELPLQVSAPSLPPPARHVAPNHHASLITVAVLLLALSGLVGYRFTSIRGGATTTAASNDPAPPAPLEPRIIERGHPRPTETTPIEPGLPAPLVLAVVHGAFSPSFGANGTLLFHAGRNASGQLFSTTVDPQGRAAAVQPLFSDGARNYHPRLSADGTRVAFDSDREGERAVYIADRSGEHVTRVSGPGHAAVPSWSPDGTLLAFIKAEPDHSRVWNLWVMTVATGELRRHTSFRSGQVWGASWFPDGRRLAFSHEDQLIISDLHSSSPEVHVSPIQDRLVRTPAVSPDGLRIVFQVYRDGVWMLDLGTGAMRRVLDDATAEEFAWDPEGRRIAYHSHRDGAWRIWVMGS